jgi:hypothetical protein
MFLPEGLDRLLVICPSCQFVAGQDDPLAGQITRAPISGGAAK